MNLLFETDKACFYLCRDNAENSFILKVYKKNKKCLMSTLTDIKHTNAVEVVKEGFVFDAETSENKQYEIMPYIEKGIPLSKKAPLTENEAFEITRQIADCLNMFHQKGLIHRNVTPDNILLDGTKPLLTSYGCVTDIDLEDDVNEALTQVFKKKEEVTGTEGYIAPEVYSGIISPAVDFFSLGMTLFYLLTGRTICDNKEFKKSLLSGTFIDEVNRTAQLTIRSKQIISGLITLQHDKRWRANDLERFFKGEDVEVYSDWNPPEPFVFRRKKIFDLKTIAADFLKHPVSGARMIKKHKLTKYLLQLGLDKMAEQINQLIANEQNSYSSMELCSAVYLAINNMTYKICEGKELKTKEDFYSLSEQLKKRVEYLVLSKEPLFCMWLSILFNVNLNDFHSELKCEENFERFVVINEKRNAEGLWPLLIQFLTNKEINVDVKQLPDSFFLANAQKIITMTDCDEFRKNGNLLAIIEDDNYVVYNLIDCKRIVSNTFSDIKGFKGGFILFDGKHEPSVIIQRGRNPFVKSLTETLEFFLSKEDYKSLNTLISISFELFHANKYIVWERKVLDYVEENHNEDLSAFARLYYSLIQWEKGVINTYAFSQKIEEMRDEVSKKKGENSYIVLNEIGKIFYQLDRKDDAMKCFEKGMTFDIHKEMINELAIGIILSEQKKYKDAVAYYRLCLNERPELIRGNEEIFSLYTEACASLGLSA